MVNVIPTAVSPTTVIVHRNFLAVIFIKTTIKTMGDVEVSGMVEVWIKSIKRGKCRIRQTIYHFIEKHKYCFQGCKDFDKPYPDITKVRGIFFFGGVFFFLKQQPYQVTL